MKTLIKSFLISFSLICLLSGCNTVKGFGQDMQQGGRALQNAAYQ